MTFAHALKTLAFNAIGERVRAITGSKAALDDFASPAGDVGLFGPQSMAWRVHAHFTAMMVGGLSSLMVQSLHPRALAAVWDHSDFRQNLQARLGRTAYFVAATTYGGQAMALKAIGRVNAIHANIRGTDLQGQPYVANEPELIRWVHLVEVASFLGAYQHLARQPLSPRECDQYISEMTQVGHLLGAVDLPVTYASTQSELRGFAEVLRFDARAREILQVIQSYPTALHDKPWMALVLQCAFDLMPTWVLALMGKSPACAVQKHATRLVVQLSAEPVQWMLSEQGVSAIARKRVQAQTGS
ncbi:MAG: hypothetical protein CFE39_09030 [Comamonadaceae bacterium PBBC2]|nr:MAG: hypothetical protein CFE39_09030 [Comamonadaceae bacterium PBBC2]